MNDGSTAFSALNKIANWYQTIAVTLLTVAVLLFVVNSVLYFYVRSQDRKRATNPVERYGMATVASAYPGWTTADVAALIHETWDNRHLIHHPFAQFVNEPHSGRFVSVVAPGFRVVKNQAPWPPRSASKNLFFFGGSTAFGLGVTNSETIASFVQEALQRVKVPIAVYNFGTPAFASRQEATLFFDFLTSGNVPDVAVFLDGVNEYTDGDKPALTMELSRDVAGKAVRDWLYLKVPMIRLTYDMLHRAQASSGASVENAQVEATARRWQATKRAIEAMAAAFHVQVLFVWQPVPYYNYDGHYDPFCAADHACVSAPHEALYRRIKTLGGELGRDYLWLGDLQQGHKTNLYVDSVHYNPAFSQEIAEAIAARLATN